MCLLGPQTEAIVTNRTCHGKKCIHCRFQNSISLQLQFPLEHVSVCSLPILVPGVENWRRCDIAGYSDHANIFICYRCLGISHLPSLSEIIRARCCFPEVGAELVRHGRWMDLFSLKELVLLGATNGKLCWVENKDLTDFQYNSEWCHQQEFSDGCAVVCGMEGRMSTGHYAWRNGGHPQETDNISTTTESFRTRGRSLSFWVSQ